MSEQLTCGLCGREGHDVLWSRPVLWTDEHRRRNEIDEPYASVDRCTDFQACRARVESSGKAWPVVDAVTRPTVKAPPSTEEVPV